MLQGHTGEGAQDLSGVSGEGKRKDETEEEIFYIKAVQIEHSGRRPLEVLYNYIKDRTRGMALVENRYVSSWGIEQSLKRLLK